MPDNAPVESVYNQMREMTKMDTPIPDRRGPLVYELTQEPSLNGIQPNRPGDEAVD